MAGSIPLKPPEAFNFRKPHECSKWIKRFEQFRLASGLSGESDTRQVSTLLYCMGEEVEDVLSSTDITTEERKTYKTVLAKLNDYFKCVKRDLRENQVQPNEPTARRIS